MRLIKLILLLAYFSACSQEADLPDIEMEEENPCYTEEVLDNQMDGCDGDTYAAMDSSIYILPYKRGTSYRTGLTNCSSSWHAAGREDQYAFDFDMPNDTDFFAIRAGRVVKIIDHQPNFGNGSSGNVIIIDHDDGTLALYYHSPPDGFVVEVGDSVEQGQKLGVTGTSGYAGYPHLHLIVVKDSYEWPYQGIPISFNNAYPRHTVLKSYTNYEACEH